MTSDDRRPGDVFAWGREVETSTSTMEGDLVILVDQTKPKGWPDRMIVLRTSTANRVVKDLTMTAEQAENMASLLVAAAAEARK